MKKNLFVVFIALLVLSTVCITLYTNNLSDVAAETQASLLENVELVDNDNNHMEFSADGYLKSKSEAKVSTQISAEVKEVRVSLGSIVSKGDVIAVLDDTELQRKVREDRAKELLARVGLADKMNNKPNQLSGGQIQRVAIARSLITGPSIILAGEPTGNLDESMTAEIISYFKQLNQEGQTIVLVTHDPEIARQADRVVTIEGGEITSDSKADANNR